MWARLKGSWRRLLRNWVLFSFWFVTFGPALGLVYYTITGPSEFDQVVQGLKGEASGPANAADAITQTINKYREVLAAVRIGGQSFYRDGIGYSSSTLGLSVDDPNYTVRSQKVWDGVYQGTYRATYLGWFRGRLTPQLIAVIRDVTRQGPENYQVQVTGLGSLFDYAALCVLGAALAVVFFEIIPSLRKTNKSRPPAIPERH